MKSRLSILRFVLVLSTLVVSGCGVSTAQPVETPTAPETEYCTDAATGVRMSYQEAVDIAQGSECTQQGQLKESHFCNGNTGTWWIDLDIDKPGCNPACVISVTDRTAEINWRCTGAIPPEETADSPLPTVESPLPTASPVATVGEPAVCWYGRVESAPEGAQFDDYLVLLPEEARRGVGLTGADEAVETEIEGLRDSGAYAHFWGAFACDVPDFGGCQLVVTRLRREGPEGPFFEPDPVEGWQGSIVSTPGGTQFDDYFVLAGSIPVGYGIDSLDPAIATRLEGLRDTGAIVRVWGQVTCPAIDVYGTQIQVTRIEVVREAPLTEATYAGWKVYTSAKFGYAVRYPADCTVMGSNLDRSVEFVGPLVNNEHWPWLTISHTDCDFCHPPADADVRQWLADVGVSGQVGSEVQIAGLPTVHFVHEGSPQSYASDEYYFIKDDQLFFISILHAGRKQDWDLYDKFLRSFTFD